MGLNRPSQKAAWKKLIGIYGSLCFYCGIRTATSVDHVEPWSYAYNDDLDNKRPSCQLCNFVAGDKVFDDVWAKKFYINKVILRRYGKRIAECTDCLLLFEYRVNSPSQFLCAECYDYQYDAAESLKTIWKKWLKLLQSAGYQVEFYRDLRKYREHNIKVKRELLLDILIEHYDAIEDPV